MDQLIADLDKLKADFQTLFGTIQTDMTALQQQNAALSARVQNMEQHLQHGGGPGFQVKL